MQNVIEIIEQLRCKSGNEQISFLNQNRENDLLKQILLYTYDPNKKYKIDELKLNKIEMNNYGELEFTITWFKQFCNMLDNLALKKASTDEDIFKIKSFIYQFKPKYTELLKQVLLKDLRINMGVKKIQKVWKDFCLEPQVQLAKKFEGKYFKYGFYSRKVDGTRSYVLDGKLYTRTNKLHNFEPVKHIVKQLNTLYDINYYVLDGELVYIEDGKEDFQKTISLVRSEDRSIECNNIYFMIFDIIPKNEFLNKNVKQNFLEEYTFMRGYLDAIFDKDNISYSKTKLPNILVLNQFDSSVDIDYIKQLKENVVKYNWEGLMLRNDVPYECKRTSNLLKIKKFNDIEVEIVGFIEGKDKYCGKLGALQVKYKDSVVNVGSGFTDEQREKYWCTRESIIGTYAKIKYFEETQDKNGNYSLRFPVFMAFRDVCNDVEWV